MRPATVSVHQRRPSVGLFSPAPGQQIREAGQRVQRLVAMGSSTSSQDRIGPDGSPSNGSSDDSTINHQTKMRSPVECPPALKQQPQFESDDNTSVILDDNSRSNTSQSDPISSVSPFSSSSSSHPLLLPPSISLFHPKGTPHSKATDRPHSSNQSTESSNSTRIHSESHKEQKMKKNRNNDDDDIEKQPVIYRPRLHLLIDRSIENDFHQSVDFAFSTSMLTRLEAMHTLEHSLLRVVDATRPGTLVYKCPLCDERLLRPQRWKTLFDHYVECHWKLRRYLGHYVCFPCRRVSRIDI